MMKVKNQSVLIGLAAVLMVLAFVSCEGPIGPMGPGGISGEAELIASQDFSAVETADIADGTKIKGASWGADGSFTAAIVERSAGNKAFVVTYTDAGGDPGNGGWWWSDNNAAFIDDG